MRRSEPWFTALASRLFYLWRIPATGLGFAVFGLGGLFLALTLFPLVVALTPDPARRRLRIQNLIERCFRVYIGFLSLLGVIAVTTQGQDQLRQCRGRLIIANHPTLLDVVLLMALVPRAQCVVKHQLWDNFFLGPVVRGAGYLRNDLDAEAFLAACRQSLGEGRNLIIFPEGTRSVPGQPLKFQRGFATIALLAPADLQVIRITCEPVMLTKGTPWYRVPVRRGRYHVTIAETVAVDAFLRYPSRGVGARRLAAHVLSHFSLSHLAIG